MSKKEIKSNDNKTIKVLGQTYTILENKAECDKLNADGLSDYYNKKIYIKPYSDMFDTDPNINDETKIHRYNEVLRHEIIHIMFDESGLDDYSKNEQLVDWIARQSIKFNEIFDELNI